MRRVLLLLACLVLACGSSQHASSTTVASATARGPEFIENDYARALGEAKQSKRPLFVDAWAPWCHTCLSMRAYVFDDPSLASHSGDFVWLAVDTERPESAKFVEQFPMQVWPTLWVIDPKTEKPALKWLGSATPPELVSLLEDAKAAVEHGDAGGEAGVAFLRGNQASAEGNREAAVEAYRLALEKAPAGWPRRGQVIEALSARLSELKVWDACVELAVTEMPSMPPGTSLANLVITGLDCAEHAPAGTPSRGQVNALAAAIERLATDRTLPILADDRSGLFETLVDHYKEDGRATDAKVVALKWAEFLEGEAKRAPSPAARAVFDAHRTLAYLALDQPERALPMLAQSEHDFPADYNPPARIAAVYLKMKRYDEALAAVDRALSRGYGPRKLRLYSVKADILAGKGDDKALAATLREALAYSKTVPLAGGYSELLGKLDKRLADLTSSTPSPAHPSP